MPEELSDYEKLPWYRRWLLWWWWRPRVLWWTWRARGGAIRDHDTGEVCAHHRWRSAWMESNAIADLRMGHTYPMFPEDEDEDDDE